MTLIVYVNAVKVPKFKTKKTLLIISSGQVFLPVLVLFFEHIEIERLFFDWCVGPVKKVRRTGREETILVQSNNNKNSYFVQTIGVKPMGQTNQKNRVNSWDFQGRKDEVFK